MNLTIRFLTLVYELSTFSLHFLIHQVRETGVLKVQNVQLLCSTKWEFDSLSLSN